MNLKKFYLSAASIDEILSDNFESLIGQKSETDKGALRLAAWCRASTSGNWILFNKRLNRDLLTCDFVLSRFSSADVKPEIDFPQWVLDADWIRSKMSRTHMKSDCLVCTSYIQRFPFGDLFPAVIEHAENLVHEKFSKEKIDFLNDQGRLALKTLLLQQITDLSSPALYEIFSEYKSKDCKHTIAFEAGEEELTDRGLYRAFVDMMLEGGINQLFDAKPVLLRLIASIVRQWISVTTEFIHRFSADQELIRKILIPNINQLSVTDIRGDLSDRHNSGHSVLIIEFSNYSKLVYKPKDCRLDAAFSNLVNRLNENNVEVFLRTPKIIAQDGYGWSEFVGNINVEDPEAIRRFFHRSGAWLALFHVLVGADMHYENIIAHGEHPIPIDIEMILQSQDHDLSINANSSTGAALAAARTVDSVLTVGLLPAYVRTSRNELVSTGGMGEHSSINQSWEWSNLNSDAMKPTLNSKNAEPVVNLPSFKGKIVNASDYLEDILQGFKTYWCYLLAMRDKYGAKWLLDGFSNLSTRRVIRPTRFYHALTQRLCDHRTMNDGITWSAQVDFVSRFANWEQDIDNKWEILEHERFALTELNIPIFYTSINEEKLTNPRGLLLNLKFETGWIRASRRISELSIENANWQCEIIKTSLITNSSYGRHTSHTPNETDAPLNGFNSEFFLNEARAVAEVIKATAIQGEKSTAWIGIEWHGDSNFSQLTPLGADLYSGSSGISLFLAAFGVQVKDQESIDLAMTAIYQLRKDLRGVQAQRFARGLGLGGISGLGSIIYSLSVLSELLNNKELLEDALAAAKLISDELIDADTQLDMLNGSAGAILALLRLFRLENQDWILERAIKCGEHLLQTPRLGVPGKRSWAGNGVGRTPLNGISHGAAGFALSLSALAAASGRDDFHLAAVECIDYENNNFDHQVMNWPDFRQGIPSRDTVKVCQWCHGAIGIGLARLGMSYSPNQIHPDVIRALKGAKLHGPKRQASLCCGELGRIEFLLESWKRTGDTQFFIDSQNFLGQLIKSAHRNGGYEFGGGAKNFHLSLFRGIAGVGYTALRQVNQKLPNVLLLE